MHTSPLAPLGGKETGGMNVYVRELARELAAQGVQVDVFTRNRDSDSHIHIQPFAPRARVINIPAGPPKAYNKSQLYQHLPQFVSGIQAWAERTRTRYDVLHSHYWVSALAALELERVMPGTPIVHMFHTLGAMKNRAPSNVLERESDQRIACEGEIMRTVDRVIASTPIDRRQMIDLYNADPARIVVIPPGVDLDLFHPVEFHAAKDMVGSSYDDHTVLYVGRFDPVKGIDVWFHAMKIVVEKDPSLRYKMCVCLIGGDLDEEVSLDAEFQRLQSLKEDLGIDDIVTFMGKRSQQTLPSYYSAADAVVMPSHYESFGLVALEAMACGAPVIASDVGGLSFLVRDGETGYLFPEGQPEPLADAVLRILHDRSLRDRLGANGTRVARAFAWPQVTRQIVELYQELAQPTYAPVHAAAPKTGGPRTRNPAVE